MLLVKAKSGPSKIEGTGLFADQFIPKGTVVWKFLPGFDRMFPADYPESLPKPLKKWFKSAASFDDGVWTLAGDHSVLMNHSDTANLSVRDDATNKGEADMVANRDIRRGEELTVFYWEFDAPSRERGGAALGEENYMSHVSDYMNLFRTTAGLTHPEPLDEVSAAQRKVLELQQTLAGLLKDSVKSWGDIAFTYTDSFGRKVTRKATVSAPMPSVVANVRGGYTALIALMETPYQAGAPMHARVIRQLPAHRQIEMPLASLAEELTDYDFTMPDEPDADKGEYRAKNAQIAKNLDVALKAVQKGVKGFKVSVLQKGDTGNEWKKTYWAKLDMMPDAVRAPVVAKSMGEAQTPKTVPIPELKWVSAKNKYDDEAVTADLPSKEGDLYTLHAGNDYAPDGNTFNGKWKVSVYRTRNWQGDWRNEGRILEKRGLASFAAAEKFLKAEVGKMIAAKRFATPPAAIKATPAEDVADVFRGKTTKTGGRLKVLQVEQDFVRVEPLNRQRLDHYGTSYDDEGEEQEGWDSEGWHDEYALPLSKEVEAILKANDIKGWEAEIGEKGHIDLQRVS